MVAKMAELRRPYSDGPDALDPMAIAINEPPATPAQQTQDTDDVSKRAEAHFLFEQLLELSFLQVLRCVEQLQRRNLFFKYLRTNGW